MSEMSVWGSGLGGAGGVLGSVGGAGGFGGEGVLTQERAAVTDVTVRATAGIAMGGKLVTTSSSSLAIGPGTSLDERKPGRASARAFSTFLFSSPSDHGSSIPACDSAALSTRMDVGDRIDAAAGSSRNGGSVSGASSTEGTMVAPSRRGGSRNGGGGNAGGTGREALAVGSTWEVRSSESISTPPDEPGSLLGETL
jgi:hypothetical protein